MEEPAAEEPAAPELDPIDRLAADIDQFSFDYDTYEYRDRVDDREEALRELTAALHGGDSDGIRDWLREFADENEPGEANEKLWSCWNVWISWCRWLTGTAGRAGT